MIGRLFNTVGPRQTGRYGMVVPSFVRQALAGEPITVYGDGQQRRCFCHVKDVVRAMADLMETEQAVGEVFNIGSTEEITMLELAERVRQACESDSEIRLVPYEEAYEAGFEDMRRRIPDTAKIERAARLAPDPHARRDTRGRDRVPESARGARAERVIDAAGHAPRGGAACLMKPG